MKDNRALLICGLVASAAVMHILPHPWNFSPIGALALFGGAKAPSKVLGVIMPLAALFLGDCFIGFHKLMPFVYACFIATVLMGFWVRQNSSGARIALCCLASSLLFFVVTNFANWLCLKSYPNTAAGLIQCYIAGLPFLRNGVCGDLFYAAVVFGGLRIAETRFPSFREAAIERAEAARL